MQTIQNQSLSICIPEKRDTHSICMQNLVKSSFRDCKTIDLGFIFIHKKLILYFFQVWLFSFNIIPKNALIIYLEKLKNGGFTLLNKPLEPYKLP